jgi:WD repeat-containing protein 19
VYKEQACRNRHVVWPIMKQIFSLLGKNGNGKVIYKWQKKRSAFLASAGTNNAVNIFDRNGQMVAEIPLTGACKGLDWDAEGDMLAIISDGPSSSVITLWDANTQKVSELDMGMKASPTFLSWSHTGSQLAVGTNKGNLFVYDHKTARKIPLIGKHNKAITTGQWSKEGLLCLASNGSITVNNNEGGLIMAITINGEPSDLQLYYPPPTSELHKEGPKLSVSIDKETLFLAQISNQDNQLDLAF